MADIELVIKIPEGLKKDFESEQWTALSCMEMKNALKKATPIPEGHGKLIDISDIEPMRYTVDGGDYFDDYEAVDWEDIEKAPTIIEADKPASAKEKSEDRDDDWER